MRHALSLVNPTQRTEAAFARQERMLAELCAKMSLEELLDFGFEKRLGRGQALTPAQEVQAIDLDKATHLPEDRPTVQDLKENRRLIAEAS